MNEKLATIENFQGTRGVLRTLALVVRNIWDKKRPIPMIHTCHVDLQDPYIVSELVGRSEGLGSNPFGRLKKDALFSSALTLEILTGLDSYFFEKTETPLVHDIRLNFSCKRNWPILEDITQLDSVLREGVKRGKWCIPFWIDWEAFTIKAPPQPSISSISIHWKFQGRPDDNHPG